MPKAFHQAMGANCGGRITFRVENGVVSVRAGNEPEADPALASFLALIERDIAARPGALAALTADLASRMVAASEDIAVDADKPIEGEVAL